MPIRYQLVIYKNNKAEKTDKRFAIYFDMEGDEIKAVHRCFGYHHSDKEVPHLDDVFDYEAFYVHEHEKIGFINSYELDELRKNVKLFMAAVNMTKSFSLGNHAQMKKKMEMETL